MMVFNSTPVYPNMHNCSTLALFYCRKLWATSAKNLHRLFKNARNKFYNVSIFLRRRGNRTLVRSAHCFTSLLKNYLARPIVIVFISTWEKNIHICLWPYRFSIDKRPKSCKTLPKTRSRVVRERLSSVKSRTTRIWVQNQLKCFARYLSYFIYSPNKLKKKKKKRENFKHELRRKNKLATCAKA